MSSHLYRTLHHRHTSAFLRKCPLIRSFSSQRVLLSGHNRWSKIKHDKAKEDAGKSKQRSALTEEIRAAAKLHGPDPTSNPRLASLITIAKKSGLPKTIIDGAIARGTGKSLSGTALEPLTIEAMLPPSIAAIIECETDNRLRTLADLRYLIKEFGGTMTPTGHLFERVGRVVVLSEAGLSAGDVFDVAIEAGATDVEEGDAGEFVISTEPQETAAVAEGMGNVDGLRVLSSEIVWAPKEESRLEEKNSEILGDFVGMRSPPSFQEAKNMGGANEIVDKLEEDASVQSVYLNVSRRL